MYPKDPQAVQDSLHDAEEGRREGTSLETASARSPSYEAGPGDPGSGVLVAVPLYFVPVDFSVITKFEGSCSCFPGVTQSSSPD